VAAAGVASYMGLCAIVKDQREDILEWIEWHRWGGLGTLGSWAAGQLADAGPAKTQCCGIRGGRRSSEVGRHARPGAASCRCLGVQQFYIYDNNSSRPLMEILWPYIDAGGLLPRVRCCCTLLCGENGGVRPWGAACPLHRVRTQIDLPRPLLRHLHARDRGVLLLQRLAEHQGPAVHRDQAVLRLRRLRQQVGPRAGNALAAAGASARCLPAAGAPAALWPHARTTHPPRPPMRPQVQEPPHLAGIHRRGRVHRDQRHAKNLHPPPACSCTRPGAPHAPACAGHTHGCHRPHASAARAPAAEHPTHNTTQGGKQPLPVPDLFQVLRPYEKYGGLALNWRMFGSSGHVKRPQLPVTQAYTKAFPLGHSQHRWAAAGAAAAARVLVTVSQQQRGAPLC
jgi:hypothetical protein